MLSYDIFLPQLKHLYFTISNLPENRFGDFRGMPEIYFVNFSASLFISSLIILL